MRTLLIFLFWAASLAASDLISNGDFSADLQHWRVQSHPEMRHIKPRVMRATTGNVATVTIKKAAAQGYLGYVQEVEVKSNTHYRFTAEIRGVGEGAAAMVVRQEKKPGDRYGCGRGFKPTRNWQRYEVTFVAPSIDPSNPPNARIGVGGFQGRIDLRNVSLVELPGDTVVRNKTGGDLKQVVLEEAAPAEDVAEPDATVDAAELVAEFTASSMKARKTYDKKTLAISGRLTRVTAGSRDASVLELEGGAIKVQAELSEEDLDFITRELKAAKERIDDFADYARAERIASKERKVRELDAYPSVTVTGTFTGYRSNAALFRDGRDLSVSGGEELPKVTKKRRR
jgi:hypothetical protein